MDRIEKILVFVVVATIVIIVTIALSTSRGGDDDLMGTITGEDSASTEETKSADGRSAMEGSAATEPDVSRDGDRSADGEGLPPEVIAPRRSTDDGTAHSASSNPAPAGNAGRAIDGKGALGSLNSPSSVDGGPEQGSGKPGTTSRLAQGGAARNAASDSAAPSGIAADAIPLADEPRFETVRKNDSYWKIAERLYGNGKHWPVLQDANKDVPAASLRPGIKILVPEFEPAAKATIPPTLSMDGAAKSRASKKSKSAKKATAKGDGTYRVVTLRKGDYLYKLLRELKMTKRYREVLALNGLTAAQASTLREGHEIKIPTTPAKKATKRAKP